LIACRPIGLASRRDPTSTLHSHKWIVGQELVVVYDNLDSPLMKLRKILESSFSSSTRSSSKLAAWRPSSSRLHATRRQEFRCFRHQVLVVLRHGRSRWRVYASVTPSASGLHGFVEIKVDMEPRCVCDITAPNVNPPAKIQRRELGSDPVLTNRVSAHVAR